MDDRDEEPVVIYHSHTATEAYPSRTDIALRHGAGRALRARLDPRARTTIEFRSFRIVDGEVTEEEVRVVDDVVHGPATCLTPDPNEEQPSR